MIFFWLRIFIPLDFARSKNLQPLSTLNPRLLSKQSKAMEKVSGLGDLGPLMPGLASSCNMDVILTLDNFVHRLCGFQQVYEIPMLFGEILNDVVNSIFLLALTGALYITICRETFLRILTQTRH